MKRKHIGKTESIPLFACFISETTEQILMKC